MGSEAGTRATALGLGGPPQLCSMARDPRCRETTQESWSVDPGCPVVQPLHKETGTQRARAPGTWVRNTRFSAGAGSISALLSGGGGSVSALLWGGQRLCSALGRAASQLCPGVGRGLPCLPRAAEAPHTDVHSALPGDGHGHCARCFSGKESGAVSSGDWEPLLPCGAGFPSSGHAGPPPLGSPASRLWTRPRLSQVSPSRWAQGLPRAHACLCSCRPSPS